MNQLWTLATTWYSTRLQVESRRPKPDEMRGIFAGLGLEGDFWDPTSDSFAFSNRVGPTKQNSSDVVSGDSRIT
jgi:hypothetical protein